MKIALFEPYYAGSHKRWCDDWRALSRHEIRLFTLPAGHWKWRMHGASITLFKAFLESGFEPDLCIVTDMMDLTSFRALNHLHRISAPCAVYFHENQITYPWSPTDPDTKLHRDRHYGFINYLSALAADAVIFNSEYHRHSFTSALPPFLKDFPDYKNIETVDQILLKSTVLYPGLMPVKIRNEKSGSPVLLWNHRWEFDKNPVVFFNMLFELKEQGKDFRLIVTGEQFPDSPKIFEEAKIVLSKETIHWGYCNSMHEYHRLLALSDILFVTSHQDFFGYSVVEAILAGVIPFLPRRLSYPEHIKNEELFYANEDEMKSKMVGLLDTPREKFPFVGDRVNNYLWENCLEDYDRYFEQLAKP